MTDIDSVLPLWEHQRRGVLFARTCNRLGLFFDLGTGKSPTAATILREHYAKHGKIVPTVILAPKSVCHQWVDMLVKWAGVPRDKVVLLRGAGAQKQLAIRHTPKDSIIICNYEMSRTAAWASLVWWGPQVVVCDEAHKLKAYNSLAHKSVYMLTMHVQRLLLLTATPTSGNLLDIYGLARLLNEKVLGHNFMAFRNTYFVDINAARARTQSYFPNWQPKKGAETTIMDKLAPCCIKARAFECIDLPEKVIMEHIIELPEKIAKMYKALAKDWLVFINENTAVTAEFKITQMMKLRQVACGFIMDTERGNTEWLDNFRLEKLEEILEAIPEDESVIIWVPFIALYERIAAVCAKLRMSVVYVKGGQTDKDRQTAIECFTKRSMQVLISNPQAGGAGLNLQVARHAIWFAHNYNLSDHEQSEGRNFRGGSIDLHKSVVHHHIIAKGTVDEAVYAALLLKKNNVDRLMQKVGEKSIDNLLTMLQKHVEANT
ncbi:MAG: DEAD/DEAH box helicase [Thiofilum sp.]|uniref:DEAD/DEAH box helicase n=1 Tax=Thiofilum sp. TaxID=2212733 RepID=UPI0025D3C5CF|nr:DEAD/DEAH box helicase [Thiofilum sp.]MBK8455630.1 DEAD/DEAH box helicase [Thiofilum sp.]